MSPLLEARNLTKSFGGVHATRDVSLAIPRHEFHAIIGPNGAGKTTLISQLFGEIRPDSGSVLLDGAEVTRAPPFARAQAGMARSFQITTLAKEMTALDNMLVAQVAKSGRTFQAWRPVRLETRLLETARAALARIGLAERADVEVAQLSHGEQRQLELAIALTGSPKLILLDEPMAGLGPDEGRTMTELLRGLKGSVTVILVEHDMEAVFNLAERISVLVRGEIVAVGTPEEIRRDPVVRDAYLGDDA